MSQENTFSVGREEYQLAGWGKRFFAYLFDLVLVGVGSFLFSAAVLSLILIYPAIIINFGEGLNGDGSVSFISDLLQFIMLTAPVILFPALFGLIYWGVAMSRSGEKNGQSLGQQIFGIKVVREDGQAVSFWWAGLRQVVVIWFLFLNILLVTILAPLLNFLWPLWDSKRQALHDKIVKSRVVLAK